jgi:hypothetical protein
VSFPEILEAVKALPRAEQVRLMHLLVDELGTAPTGDDIPEHLRHLMPPQGTVFDIWFPEANPGAAVAALEALLEEDRKGEG